MNKTYFLGSNTAYGFFGDFSHLTRGKTVILKGGAGTGKSTLMKKVNGIALDAGFMTETYRCSSDVSSFDAVFVPSKNFAVIDGTSPHVTEAEIPLVSGFVFNLLDAADEKKIAPYKDDIKYAASCKKQYFNDAYCNLNCANLIFENNKRKLSAAFNKAVASAAKDTFAALELSHGLRETRFVSAISDEGFVDFLSDDFKGLYTIGVRAEYPEIIMLYITKLLSLFAANDVEYTAFRSPFSPDFFDAVKVGNVVIADIDRFEKCDEIITLDAPVSLTLRTDLDAAENLHRTFVDKAIANIRLARLTHIGIEKIYSPAMDWTDVNNKTDKILCLLFDC